MNCISRGPPIKGCFRLELLQSDIWKLSEDKGHPFFLYLHRNNSDFVHVHAHKNGKYMHEKNLNAMEYKQAT